MLNLEYIFLDPWTCEHFYRRTNACAEMPVTRDYEDMPRGFLLVIRLADWNRRPSPQWVSAYTKHGETLPTHHFIHSCQEDDFSRYSGMAEASPKPQRTLSPLLPLLWLGLRLNNSEHVWRRLWRIQEVWPERLPPKEGLGSGWKQRTTKSPINHLAVQLGHLCSLSEAQCSHL